MSVKRKVPEQPFASAILVALTIQSLRNRDPKLLLPDAHEPDYLSNAKTAGERKSRIIDYAYDIGGAVPLLEVGRELGEFMSTPVLQVLLKSANTGILADKWTRLEKTIIRLMELPSTMDNYFRGPVRVVGKVGLPQLRLKTFSSAVFLQTYCVCLAAAILPVRLAEFNFHQAVRRQSLYTH